MSDWGFDDMAAPLALVIRGALDSWSAAPALLVFAEQGRRSAGRNVFIEILPHRESGAEVRLRCRGRHPLVVHCPAERHIPHCLRTVAYYIQEAHAAFCKEVLGAVCGARPSASGRA